MRPNPFYRDVLRTRHTSDHTQQAPDLSAPTAATLIDDHRRSGYLLRPPLQPQPPMSAPDHFATYNIPHYSSAPRPANGGYFDAGSHYGGDMQVTPDMLPFAPTGPRKPSGLTVTAPPPDATAPAPSSWSGMDMGPGVPAMVAPTAGATNLMGEPAGGYGRQPLDGTMPPDPRSSHSTMDTRPYSSGDDLGAAGGAGLRPGSFGATSATLRSSNETLGTASLATGTTANGMDDSAASTSPQRAAAKAQDAGSERGSSRGRNGSSLSSGGPITVGDIVTRTIHERRKRPIPKDPTKLTQLDAPIPPRRKMFKAPQTNSENDKDSAANEKGGIQFQRGSKRRYKPDETVDEMEAQRIRNTLAARRHRLHKAEQWRDMQNQLDALRARNQELEASHNGLDLQHLREENMRLRQQANALEYECHMFRARLQSTHSELARFPDPRRQMPY